MNADGNILVALSSDNTVPSSVVSLLSELDIILPADRAGLVVDHFNYDAASAAEKHDVLLVSPPQPVKEGIEAYFTPEEETAELIAVPRGIGHALGQSHLLNPVLRAPDTAYSYHPEDQPDGVDASELFASGSQLGLVSTMQARNSARVTVVGAAEMLTDKWFDAKVKKADGGKAVGTWNREFAKRVSGWTFKETGVLRVNWIEHHLNEEGASGESNPKLYRVKNNVVSNLLLSSPLHQTKLTTARPTPSLSPSTPGTPGPPTPPRRPMLSSSSSPCSPPSTASTSRRPTPPPTMPPTPPPSPCPTSTAFSTFSSTTSGPS